MTAGTSHVSSKIRLQENSGPRLLIERITASTKDKTVKERKANHTNTSQRAGKDIDNVATLLRQIANAK
ncbi:hypothetical protein PTTG_27397 [Puccinia triticina 1-1 BBBD Race 1]|uniref:Uncharacterized protein n=1 Tax=Puccinia triticina (isolate 1-1 / race 1 (BBBD)) TaxID=630390 RepID=A0A180GKN0_PUCT1|nr:hypothetical protein PTTG_27397 [Puccinia triticina 1-1 BBBD Race 1]